MENLVNEREQEAAEKAKEVTRPTEMEKQQMAQRMEEIEKKL